MSLAERLNPSEIRRRLINPPIAVKDRPVEMRNGHPVVQMRDFGVTPEGDVFFQACLDDFNKSVEPGPKRSSKLQVREIIQAVSRHYDLPVLTMLSRRRNPRLVNARQVVMWLAFDMTDWSYPEIGRRMGGREHTTIMHGIRRIEMRRGLEPELQKDLDQLLSALRPHQEMSNAENTSTA